MKKLTQKEFVELCYTTNLQEIYKSYGYMKSELPNLYIPLDETKYEIPYWNNTISEEDLIKNVILKEDLK